MIENSNFQEKAQEKYAQVVTELLKEAGIDPNSNSAPNSEKTDKSPGAVEGIRWAKQGKVFKIELNRPDKFNAITWEMYDG